MDAYEGLFRAVLMPVWDEWIRHRPIASHLSMLRQTQWADPSVVRALQIVELRKLLVHARSHVPYWRELFAKHGLVPEDVRRIEDLAGLPPLTKAIIRERYADLVDARSAATHVHKQTSGSSGEPLRFEYDRGSEAFRQAVKWRTFEWLGYRPGVRALHYWGMPSLATGPRRLKVALDRALRREVWLECLEQDPKALGAVVETIRRRRPDVLVGYTIATAQLARHVVDRGLRAWGTIPVICCAEALSSADRAAIEAAFGPLVFENYGSRETMLLASECQLRDGLHTMDDAHVLEVVSGDRPALAGEPGDVLVTDLHNFGMPLIRYRLGDVAIRREGRCGCGRGLSRLASIVGRQSDMLRDAEGHSVPGMLLTVTLTKCEHQIADAQIVQRAGGDVVLRVVKGEGFADAGLDHVLASFRKYLRGVAVSVEYVPKIDRTATGKHRSIIVERSTAPGVAS